MSWAPESALLEQSLEVLRSVPPPIRHLTDHFTFGSTPIQWPRHTMPRLSLFCALRLPVMAAQQRVLASGACSTVLAVPLLFCSLDGGDFFQ